MAATSCFTCYHLCNSWQRRRKLWSYGGGKGGGKEGGGAQMGRRSFVIIYIWHNTVQHMKYSIIIISKIMEPT